MNEFDFLIRIPPHIKKSNSLIDPIKQFWDNVIKSKSLGGTIIFNASVKDSTSAAITAVSDYIKTKVFKVDIYENVNNTNTIIIASGL